MEQCGYVSITVIVNRFGMDVRSIAKSFSMMAPSHILDIQMHQQTLNLILFARSQILNGHINLPDHQKWEDLKKSSKCNKPFENWNE